MRRHRTRVVLLCLLAMVWCQLAAAAQLCGIGHADVASVSSSAPERAPCHDAMPDGDDCMASDCPAGQALKSWTIDAFVAMTPASERFALVVDTPARGVLRHDATAVRSTGPPPHFLGRLLI